ncbi:MAG: DNA internalization-related competence protein ComEC/Rec2 [Oscillospiraceae bacterium]|nr:DNA internalization-related competence protein ComEC/Rec2 [Oscillospiraceae bacterium]
MRKLAIFAGGFAAAMFAAILLFPNMERLFVGAVCVAATVLLGLLRRLLPDKARRRAVLCCVGMALGMLWTDGYDRLFLEPVRALDDTTVMLTGIVSDWPEEAEYGIKVRVRADLPQGGHTDAMLYMDEQYADLQPGDRVTTVAHCTVSAEHGGMGQAVNYNTAKGVFLLATAYGEAEITHPERIPLSAIPAQAMRRLQQGIEAACSGRTQSLVWAVVTGNRAGLEPLLTAGLKRVGMSHMVVVSGMHLAFLVGLLNLLLGRNRRLTALVSIPIIVFFVLMIGCTPSAVRAAVMLILLELAPLLGREGDTPTSLMLALLLLLAHNPYACADIGLQLSFGAVAGIALFAKTLQDRMTAGLKPGKGIMRLCHKVVRSVAAVISVTLGAQVFTIPLSAYYFDTISLISPVANVLCAWAISALFVFGAVGGIAGLLLPGAAPLIGMAAAPFGDYIYRVVTTLAQIPFAAIPAGPELYRLWLVFVYLLLGLAFVLPGKKRILLPCAMSVLTLVTAISCTVAAMKIPPLQVDVLDVGQGQSVLLRSGDGFALVDCGGDSYHEAGDAAADRLMSFGQSQLDLLVLTHYHDDHANGVPELLNRVHVKRIALPDIEPKSDLFREILARAEQEKTEVIFIREDTVLQVGKTVINLYPPLGDDGVNELGLTVLCSAQEQDILITGDMDGEIEQELLQYADLPDVEVMLAGHHGSKYSNSMQLLEAVRPDIAVFSVGAYNTYGHPASEALERFADVGAEIYRTDTMGVVTLTADPWKKGA